MGDHLGRQDLECIPAVSEEEVEQQAEAAENLWGQVQERWQEEREEVAGLLRENKRLSRDKRKGYGLLRLEAALEFLEELLAAPSMPWLMPAELELFTNSKIQSSLKKNKQDPPSHPFFNLFEEFFQAHHRLKQARRILVLVQARTWLQDELVRRKQTQDQLSFDDLLTRLEAALQGEKGGRLARSIGRRFPVILVDEFQDTDPLQYRIFAAVFAAVHRAGEGGTDAPAPSAALTDRKTPGLFLIGDPKQAIYSFRNADVFAYAAAQVKKCLEVTKELGGENYVFWGGREGYQNLLNQLNFLFNFSGFHKSDIIASAVTEIQAE